MARCELVVTLGGLCLTTFIPPRAGEPIADCAARTTGELMVRYRAQDALAHGADDTEPPA